MAERNRRGLFNRFFGRNKKPVDNSVIGAETDKDARFRVGISADFELYNAPDSVETRTPATSLPDGWHWVAYSDGSGSLRTPEEKHYISYDMCTSYAHQGGIEYDTSDGSSSVFFGTMQEFKAHAEGLVNKRLSVSLGEHNISSIINELSNNAWYGREPQTARIVAGENVIEIKGYVYEPTYECFSSTASLSLNGEELYGVDSRNVDAYRNEVYQTGKFAELPEAISYIKEKTLGQRYVLKERECDSLEKTINAAAVKSEQTDSKNVSLNRDILIK